MTPTEAVAVATSAHLGFQALVTVAVYPALAAVPPEQFPAAHEAHMRRLTIVVAPVYGAMAAAFGWALLTACCPPALLVSGAAAASAALISITLAVPTHVRMRADGPTPALVRRLLRVDRWRLAAAVVAFAAALAA